MKYGAREWPIGCEDTLDSMPKRTIPWTTVVNFGSVQPNTPKYSVTEPNSPVKKFGPDFRPIQLFKSRFQLNMESSVVLSL